LVKQKPSFGLKIKVLVKIKLVVKKSKFLVKQKPSFGFKKSKFW